MQEQDNVRDDDHVSMAEVVSEVDDVTGALEGLSQILTQNEELELVLQRCCRQATHAIRGAEYAGITLLRDGVPFTAAATDERVHEWNDIQFTSGFGPCVTAAETGKVVSAVLQDTGTSWPAFAKSAADAEIGSVLSAPLFLDKDYHGTLNLYGHGTHGYRELDAALLELYTTASEAALSAELRHRTARNHTDQLRTALTSRAVIDQAKGIIMAVRQVDADTAFAVLVTQSQRENRKLRDVAERFVANIVTPVDGIAGQSGLAVTGAGHPAAGDVNGDEELGT